MELVQTQSVQTNKILRHAGIDLLRIIAILLICFSHANQTIRGMVDFPTYSISNFISITMASFGTFGNILFVICSSYFLVDKSKSRTEKALNILFDSTLISITILVGFLFAREPLTWKTIIQQIVPDLFKLNWFVPCYVIFYLLAPIVVLGLKLLPKKVHFGFVIFSILIYGGLSTAGLPPYGSYLLQFFYILNIVAFIKWHAFGIYKHKWINLIVFFVCMFLTYLLVFVFLILTKQKAFFGRFDFTSLYSPLLVISLVAFFNFFKELNFSNKFISYLSESSLFVYVIHENYLLRKIARVRFYEFMIANYGENKAIIWMLICGAFMFVVGFILAVAYKETLHRLTKKLSELINRLITKVYDWFYFKMFKHE